MVFEVTPFPSHPMTKASTLQLARITGVLYLLIIVFGLIAQIFVRDSLVDYGNASITAENILNSEAWYRFGFVSELLMLICDVGVASLLYLILRETHKSLSVISSAFRLSSALILSVTALSHYAALSLISGSEYLNAFDSFKLHSLALFSIKIHGVGYNICLLFFGVHLVLLGTLINKSILFPKYIGLLLWIGGICYVINSLVWFQFPDWVKYIYPYIILPSAVGEWIFCFYLIVRGVKNSRTP